MDTMNFSANVRPYQENIIILQIYNAILLYLYFVPVIN